MYYLLEELSQTIIITSVAYVEYVSKSAERDGETRNPEMVTFYNNTKGM